MIGKKYIYLVVNIVILASSVVNLHLIFRFIIDRFQASLDALKCFLNVSQLPVSLAENFQFIAKLTNIS